VADYGRRRFEPRGAGGTGGGVGQFFLGLGLMALGAYLFLQSVQVTTGFAFGAPLFAGYGYGYGVPGGVLLIPLAIGVAMIFYNGASLPGWLLALGSPGLLTAGIVMSLRFSLAGVSLFELLAVLGTFAAGLGLFLRSLRPGR
jgi:hypothetical protein